MRPCRLSLSSGKKCLVWTTAFLAFTPALIQAQFTSAIEGRVSDPSDAAVPKAMVMVENRSTGVKRSVEASEVGYYRVASLPPGNFTVRVTSAGFETGVYEKANGQRAESNNFLVDNASVNGSPRGGVSNFSPSADAVQELRVSVNNFSAEYGRNSSAMVNVITKSGTNVFHGTAGWYHTNNKLTGRNSIFQPKVPVFRRNEGNGTFGGPIKKNKLFFFGSVDVLRSGAGSAFSASAISPGLPSITHQRYPTNIATTPPRHL